MTRGCAFPMRDVFLPGLPPAVDAGVGRHGLSPLFRPPRTKKNTIQQAPSGHKSGAPAERPIDPACAERCPPLRKPSPREISRHPSRGKTGPLVSSFQRCFFWFQAIWWGTKGWACLFVLFFRVVAPPKERKKKKRGPPGVGKLSSPPSKPNFWREKKKKVPGAPPPPPVSQGQPKKRHSQ